MTLLLLGSGLSVNASQTILQRSVSGTPFTKRRYRAMVDEWIADEAARRQALIDETRKQDAERDRVTSAKRAQFERDIDAADQSAAERVRRQQTIDWLAGAAGAQSRGQAIGNAAHIAGLAPAHHDDDEEAIALLLLAHS